MLNPRRPPLPVGAGCCRESRSKATEPNVKAKYLLPCSCGRQVPVEASQAGQQILCECGAAVEVPAMRGLAQLERATPESAIGRSSSAEQPARASQGTPTPAKAAARRSASVWGTRQRLLLIGALLTLLGLGMAGYFHLVRVRLVDTESMAPIQSWRLWHDLRYSIDQRPPWEEFYLASRAAYRRWMMVPAVFTGVGVVVMASSLLVPSRRRGRRVRRPGPRARASRLRRAS
jgi:hypothetical protein